MQELLVDRESNGRGRVKLLGGKFEGFSLENPEKQIRAGTHKVLLTMSERVKLGTLWTCWSDFCLPQLLDDKGDPMLLDDDTRSGIRLHAANFTRQLQGCIAFGLDRSGEGLLRSQDAFRALKSILLFPCWITITDPKE